MPDVEHRSHKGLNNRAEKFSSTDTTARADHEGLQVSPASSAFSCQLMILPPISSTFHATISGPTITAN
jgi:transposase-like protein